MVPYLNTHKHIMQLHPSVAAQTRLERRKKTYLFITDGELPLRLLVLLRKRLQLLDRLRLRHGDAELDVSFGVFVSGLSS